MRLLLLLCLTICCLETNAQITKDSLIKKMVKECCIEIKKKNFSTVDRSNYETELSMMMIPVFLKNASEIEEVYGAKFTDKTAMRKMGEDIGMKLVLDCPEFMSKMMELGSASKVIKGFDSELAPNAKDVAEPTPYALPPLPNEETQAVEKGTLVAINPGDITTLTIKTASGKTEKLYWLDYFENANDLQTNQSKYVGKKIQYSVTEQQVFNAAKKNYKTIKVISMIDLQ